MWERMKAIGERIHAIDPWAFVCLAIAAFLTYGAEWIIRHLLRVEAAKAYPHRIALKIAGLAAGIIGLLILMDVI